MSWPQKERIRQGVVAMLEGNMRFKPGERLLVMTDVPTPQSWGFTKIALQAERMERTMLGRLVAEVAAEEFPDNPTEFLPFPATGANGTEPDPGTTDRMLEADVLVCITSFSLSHTDARERATEAGARIASMPDFTAEMFEQDGPLAVDYQEVAENCRKFADRLTSAERVRVCTEYGTEITFSLQGLSGHTDDGLYGERAAWGNLPAGEAYSTPREGTGEGRIVVPAGWFPQLREKMILTVSDGLVVRIEGGGDVGDEFRNLLRFDLDDPLYLARRNLAEIGIGTNPNARRPDNVLEAEKIKGTVHIAIGDSIHMGGAVESDLHEDFIQPDPDLYLDGQKVISRGVWTL